MAANCILCDRVFVSDEDEPMDGFVNVTIRAYYGSRHDCGSDMADTEFRGIVCDDCAAPLLPKMQYGSLRRSAKFVEQPNPAKPQENPA